MSEDVAEFFGERAESYEQFIPRVVPYYHECNALLLDLVPHAPEAPLRVLDLGAGTGVLSALVLERFANASLVAIDMSAAMLAECAAKLAPWQSRVELRQGEFPADDIGTGYHLVVSSLTLHHLSHADKRAGFAKLFNAMAAGGVLLIRDVVAAATPALDQRYASLWRDTVQGYGYDDMSWFDEHLESDNPARVDDQIAWLAESGSVEVACHWRHLNCALFGGVKSG